MVIYLKKIEKYIIAILLLISVIYLSYFLDYIKYNNKINIETKLLQVENEELQQELNDISIALNLKEQNIDYKIAKVIKRDLYSFYNEIIINTNETNIGAPVLNEEGMIGIINKIENNYSYVSLLSSNINISVKINNSYGNFNNNKVTMLDKYKEINIGDKVYTSGLTSIPEGLYIGEVIEIKESKDKLSQEATIKLIDNSNLKYIGIINDIS